MVLEGHYIRLCFGWVDANININILGEESGSMNALSASTDIPAQANRNINNPQRNIYSSSVTSKASYLEKTCFESAGAAGLELPAPMMCGYRVRVRDFLQPKLSVLFGGRRGEASVVRFSGTPQWPPRDPDRGQFLCRSRELHIVKVRF